ncbi:hypothetical protein [Paenibacillus harenae]|uniref:hypothetical protein n=1 Tax=Paenibacillus harenae TaxID=306543 RepID=UPI0004237785|nr:hypothetical protein [Paenibacillus harenae]
MNKKSWITALFLIVAFLSLTGCVPGDETNTTDEPAGFFWGIWLGWIAPISLIIGLFNDDIRLYEKYNIGWWYDAGFYIAVISGFGGISLTRRKKQKVTTEHRSD